MAEINATNSSSFSFPKACEKEAVIEEETAGIIEKNELKKEARKLALTKLKFILLVLKNCASNFLLEKTRLGIAKNPVKRGKIRL